MTARIQTRLNTESQLAPYAAQVVPLKLNTASDEYMQLSRRHPVDGNSIPQIIVVRADGETMFAEATNLPGDLGSFCSAAIEIDRHAKEIATAAIERLEPVG